MNHRFRWALAANAALMLASVLFFGGAPIIICIMPALHILLFVLNSRAAETWKQVFLLGLAHIVATFVTHMLSSQLYFFFICDDTVGRAISSGLCLIGVVWATVLFVVMLVRFWFLKKREALQNE
jgi:hypothetical protein